MTSLTYDRNDEQALDRLKTVFHSNKDSVFVFVGAGLPRAAAEFWKGKEIVAPSGFREWYRKFPLWDELVYQLAKLIPAEADDTLDDFIQGHEAIDVIEHAKNSAPVDYSKLILDLLHVVESDLPEEVPPVHNALIRLQPKTIVTSNLDQLIEMYYNRIHGRPPAIVYDPEGMRTSPCSIGSRLIKIHGCITRPSSWVLTRRDYVDVWRTKKVILESIKGLLREATCLFAGYGLRDPHFNSLYDEVLYQQEFSTNKLNFNVVHAPVNPITRSYWRSRGLNLIGVTDWRDLAELFETLGQKSGG